MLTVKTQNLITSTVTAFVAASSLSASAIAGTIRHDRSDALYTNLANENQFASVGRLELTFTNYLTPAGCSGTLIRANWVLTAAHCSEYGQESLVSAGFIIGGGSYSIKSVFQNKGWARSDRDPGAGADIALYRLSSSISNINPAKLYSGTDEDLQVGTYVGFGKTGNGKTGAKDGTAGTKRAGKNTIELGGRLGYSSNRILVSDFDDPRSVNSSYPSTRPLNLEYQLAQGDSGGALFIGGLLAGVNSFIDSPNHRTGREDSNYGDISGATRVSSHRKWIREVISGLAGTGVLLSLPTTSSNLGPTTLPDLVIDESESIGDLSQPQEEVQDTWDNSEPVVANSLPGTSSNFDPTTLAQVIVDESEVLGDLSQPREVIQDTGDNSEAVPEPTTVVGGLLSLGGLILGRRRRKLAHKQA